MSRKGASQKKLDRYFRQRYIAFLEQFTRKCFAMFRRDEMTYEQICQRVLDLAEKFQSFDHIELYSPYQRALQDYTHELIRHVRGPYSSIDRSLELRKLNQLQKLKNERKYRRK